MPAERLQKIIAAAGIASRRKAEELITAGLVSVNGQTVTQLGTKADPEADNIKVNGRVLGGAERHVYLLLNKPKGYVTTVSDPEGRPTVLDLLRGVKARVFPVGRLDYLSEGLLLLTNDGALMQKLTHASSHVPKTYLVKVSGKPTDTEIDKLRNGIFLPTERTPLKSPEAQQTASAGRRRSEAVRTAPARIRMMREAENPWFEVTLIEGRNRQIRRMFEQIGHHVEKIKRVLYGPLELDVEPGEFRHLTSQEVRALQSPSTSTKHSPKALPVREGRRPKALPEKSSATAPRRDHHPRAAENSARPSATRRGKRGPRR
jgi:23S rRNA pseudouridine2605 synthase